MWSIYKMAAKARHLGQVSAKDEKQAIERAIAEFGMREEDRSSRSPGRSDFVGYP
jgi:hypothetical protein